MKAVLVSAQHRIVLTASSIDTAVASRFAWHGTCASLLDPVFDFHNKSSTLTISKGTFPPGSECMVTLKVFSGPCMWEAAMSLTTVSLPWGGNFDATPSSVLGAYAVRAEGWEDLAILKPLAYTFFIVQSDGSLLPLSFRSFRSDATVLIPSISGPGRGNVILELHVTNILGVVASVKKELRIDTMAAFIADCIIKQSTEKCLGQMQSRAPALVMAATTAAAQGLNSGSEGRANNVRERLMGDLQWAEQACSPDGVPFDGAVDMLTTGIAAIASKPSKVSLKMVNTAISMLSRLVPASARNPAQRSSTFQALIAVEKSAVAGLKSKGSSLTNRGAVERAIATGSDFASGILGSMAVGERAIELQDMGVTMQASCMRSTDLQRSNHTSAAGDGIVEVPGSMQLSGDVGLVMRTWSAHELQGPNESAGAGVVDFSAFSRDRGTFKQAEIKNLVDPVVIHLPVLNQTPRATCVWYDLSPNLSSKWNTKGCQLREVANTSVVCECFHLTRFGAFLLSETRQMPFEHLRGFELGKFNGGVAAPFIVGFCTMHLFGGSLYFMDLRDARRGRMKLHHTHKAAMLDAILSGTAFGKQTLRFAFQARHPLARVFYYGTSSSLGRYQLWDATSTSVAFSMLWSVWPDYTRQWSLGQYVWLIIFFSGGTNIVMLVLGIIQRKVVANRSCLIFLAGFLFLLKFGLFVITYSYALQVGPTWVWILVSVVATNFFIYNPISNFTWGYAQESKIVSKFSRESFQRLRQEHERLMNIDDDNELIDCVRRARASTTQSRPLGVVVQEMGAPSRAHSASIEMSDRLV